MNDLNTIPHDTPWATIVITRTGDSRNTRYRIAESEPESERQIADSQAQSESQEEPSERIVSMHNGYERWRNAKFDSH